MHPPVGFSSFFEATFNNTGGAPMGMVIEDKNGMCSVIEITPGMIIIIALSALQEIKSKSGLLSRGLSRQSGAF